MKAAIALFSRKGFETTSVGEICLAAGYSKGGFYFHFRSKGDLLGHILDSGLSITGPHHPDALLVELWAAASRNEFVRGRVTRYSRPTHSGLPKTGHDDEDCLSELLLAFDTGLKLQQHFAVPSVGKAQSFVESLFESHAERQIPWPSRPVRKAS
jgi:AcrR family transcriptional regulator